MKNDDEGFTKEEMQALKEIARSGMILPVILKWLAFLLGIVTSATVILDHMDKKP